MAPLHRTPARTTTTLLAATASLILAASGFAQTAAPEQTAPPAQAIPGQPAPPVNQDVAKKHLTAARNALAELTQLPAAAQLAGESRTRVQQLITSFNELITKNSDWRDSYAKVETSLAALLEADEPEPGSVGASGTAGAVGTSGTTRSVDPTIRAKLIEFGTHLAQFENVAGGTSSEPAEPTAPTEPSTPTGPPTTEARPPAPDQDTTTAAQDLLRHVEAIEVILNAQAVAQAAATSAAGGAVTTSSTPSGSTRTTITGPDVKLSAGQIEQIKRHLAELRQLIDKK
jgi:hypothetical protein